MKRTNWGEVIGWGFLGLLGVAMLNGIAQNPNVSPKTRSSRKLLKAKSYRI
jgi:hypothetical protein